MTKPTFDVHIHLTTSGCQCPGCYLSASLRTRYTIRLLRLFHRLGAKDFQALDTIWPQRVSQMLKESAVAYGVVLGFDGVAVNGEISLDLSQMIIPSDYVFAVCRQYPNLLPGVSINPHRHDALARLDDAIQQKAVLIKWLPSVQMIDLGAKSILPFYDKLAAAGVPLLTHAGGEKTFKSLKPEFNEVHRLQAPLDRGVTVICAHTGTRVLGSREKDASGTLLSLIRDYPNLWVDNSGLCNPSRFSHLPRLVKEETLVAKTLYGSDYPVPAHAFYYLKELGLKKVYELERIKNPLAKDIAIKRAFGYPDETLSRATAVLAHLPHWSREGS